jgi:hypothetical protein
VSAANRARSGVAGRALEYRDRYNDDRQLIDAEAGVEVRDHLVLVGGIVMNLQALETVLRYFLLRLNRQDPQFPQSGDSDASETVLTNYTSLDYLIDQYNKALLEAEQKFAVSTEAVKIRDAIAHGRLLSVLRQPPYRLWKFGKPKDNRVPVEFCEELTVEWLRAKSDMIFAEKQKVLDCFNARGYKGLQ